MKTRFASRTARTLFMLGLTAAAAFGQSGSIDLSQPTTLGATILKAFIALAGMAFVGLIIWGAMTLSTNRPRGLAMVGGGLFGALLAGLSFALVSTLTGGTVSTSMLLLQAVC